MRPVSNFDYLLPRENFLYQFLISSLTPGSFGSLKGRLTPPSHTGSAVPFECQPLLCHVSFSLHQNLNRRLGIRVWRALCHASGRWDWTPRALNASSPIANIPMKLYFVDGVRHSAVVIANNQKEAIGLATEAHGGKRARGVLFGSLGKWEVPTAHELKLPKGYRLVEGKR